MLQFLKILGRASAWRAANGFWGGGGWGTGGGMSEWVPSGHFCCALRGGGTAPGTHERLPCGGAWHTTRSCPSRRLRRFVDQGADDKNEIFKAAKDAHRAADFLLAWSASNLFIKRFRQFRRRNIAAKHRSTLRSS